MFSKRKFQSWRFLLSFNINKDPLLFQNKLMHFSFIHSCTVILLVSKLKPHVTACIKIHAVISTGLAVNTLNFVINSLQRKL